MPQYIKTKKINAIDLFAGAGGFSLAACNSGVNVLAAVEFNDDACHTYKENIVNRLGNQTAVYHCDILKLKPSKLRADFDLEPGELDLMMGGPPCQGFSTHRINSSGVDDPRNQLIIRYFDFVKEFKPKLFLVENVSGLLWKRHELYLQKFKKLSKKNGYELLGPVRLNAQDFGVPQKRERVFILGIRADYDIDNIHWPPNPSHFAPGTGNPEWKTASTVFEKPTKLIQKNIKKILGDERVDQLEFGEKILPMENDPSSIHMNHTIGLIERFKNTPINGSRIDSGTTLRCHENYNGHLDVYGRIRLAQPGPTITAGCFNPSKGRFLHPWENHGITIRHAARLQTFPDDFIFTGGITTQGKQVGNAVPIKLGEVIIKEAIKILAQPSKSKCAEA